MRCPCLSSFKDFKVTFSQYECVHVGPQQASTAPCFKSKQWKIVSRDSAYARLLLWGSEAPRLLQMLAASCVMNDATVSDLCLAAPKTTTGLKAGDSVSNQLRLVQQALSIHTCICVRTHVITRECVRADFGSLEMLVLALGITPSFLHAACSAGHVDPVAGNCHSTWGGTIFMVTHGCSCILIVLAAAAGQDAVSPHSRGVRPGGHCP